jgi:hypothetical protein
MQAIFRRMFLNIVELMVFVGVILRTVETEAAKPKHIITEVTPATLICGAIFSLVIKQFLTIMTAVRLKFNPFKSL